MGSFRAWGGCSWCVLGVLVLASATPAAATTLYHYLGNPFTTIVDESPPAGTFTTEMWVVGSFELAAPLAPNLPLTDISAQILGFSFQDGRSSVESASGATLEIALAGTNALGVIDSWYFGVIDLTDFDEVGDKSAAILTRNAVGLSDDGQLASCTAVADGTCSDFLADIGHNEATPGTWALVIPEPQPAFLLGFGLMLLAVGRRG